MNRHPFQLAPRLLTRGVAALILGATVLGSPLAGGLAAAQTPPSPEVIGVGQFCSIFRGPHPFTDVGPTFAEEIRCLFVAEITGGTTPTTYSPSEPLRRDQMATFLANTISTAHRIDPAVPGLPPVTGTAPFGDAVGNRHEVSIRHLEAGGIVRGGPGSLPDWEYGPSLPVTRDQMASMLVRTIRYLGGDDSSTGGDHFDDDDGNTHEANVNAVASLGIAGGTAPGTFSPDATVTRGQMAAFLIRTLARLADDGVIRTAHPEAG